jgi:hypothetical protein
MAVFIWMLSHTPFAHVEATDRLESQQLCVKSSSLIFVFPLCQAVAVALKTQLQLQLQLQLKRP